MRHYCFELFVRSECGRGRNVDGVRPKECLPVDVDVAPHRMSCRYPLREMWARFLPASAAAE